MDQDQVKEKPFYNEPDTHKKDHGKPVNFFAGLAGWIRGMVNPSKMEIKGHSPYQRSMSKMREFANPGRQRNAIKKRRRANAIAKLSRRINRKVA